MPKKKLVNLVEWDIYEGLNLETLETSLCEHGIVLEDLGLTPRETCVIGLCSGYSDDECNMGESYNDCMSLANEKELFEEEEEENEEIPDNS